MANKSIERKSSVESKSTVGDFVRHVAAEATMTYSGFPYDYANDGAWQRILLDISEKHKNAEPFGSVKFIFEYEGAEHPVGVEMSDFRAFWRYAWPVGSICYQWTQYLLVREYDRKYGREGRTLELSSGPLPYSALCKRHGDEIVNTDLDRVTIRIRKAFSDISSKLLRTEGKPRNECVQIDDRNLPFKDESFDKVIAVHGFGINLSEISRVLRDDGIFISAFFGDIDVFVKRNGRLWHEVASPFNNEYSDKYEAYVMQRQLMRKLDAIRGHEHLTMQQLDELNQLILLLRSEGIFIKELQASADPATESEKL